MSQSDSPQRAQRSQRFTEAEACADLRFAEALASCAAMYRSLTRLALGAALAAAALLAACGGSAPTPTNVTASIEPCNQGLPAFDVWNANFEPSGRSQLIVAVDTTNAEFASEYRLTVACNGAVVAATFSGQPCQFPPPSASGETPQCPLASVDLSSFANLSRVGCLAEVVPTQPLLVGVGECADPTRADYQLRVTLDNTAALTLTLDARDCRAPESCLHDQFGIDTGGS